MRYAEVDLSEQSNSREFRLRIIREFAAIFIAIFVIVGFIVMMYLTYVQVENLDKYNRTKDLLMIINGFVGIVIGYYFNRVSTEVRAEKAESAARTANETAQGAIAGQKNAVEEKKVASEAASSTKSELRNLASAAQALLANSGDQQTRGASVTTRGDEDHINALRDAVESAERILS